MINRRGDCHRGRSQFGVALLVLVTTMGSAATTGSSAVRLSPQDRKLIVQVACPQAGAREAENVTAATRQRNPAVVQVEVRCKSHRMEESLPIARYVQCSNQKGQWRCEDGHEAALVVIPDSGTIAVVPAGLTLKTATSVVLEASKLTVPPFSESATPFLGGTCKVKGMPVPSKVGIESFEVQCTAALLTVNRLCAQGSCHYYIVSGSR